MPTALPSPHTNRLLDTLPSHDRREFISGCTKVNLIFADILCEKGEQISHVYFPTESYISMVRPIGSHTSLEVALIGNEGMFGSALILDVDVSPLQALVQGEGPALKMAADIFRDALLNTPALQRNLSRYIFVQMSQLAQTAACTRFHVVEARLARWLLMTHDRAFSDELHITHEFLSLMLGVRRVGITKAAGALQKRKLITYSRGRIHILDRTGLEKSACDCYQADIMSYQQIMCRSHRPHDSQQTPTVAGSDTR